MINPVPEATLASLAPRAGRDFLRKTASWKISHEVGNSHFWSLGVHMSDIAEQIRNQILAWQKQSAVSVSEQAKQIIVATVSAIAYDPHPGWRLPSEMMPWPSAEDGLREVQQDAISKLPQILDEIAEQSTDKKNINTFTLLHIASTILAKTCPFDKRQVEIESTSAARR